MMQRMHSYFCLGRTCPKAAAPHPKQRLLPSVVAYPFQGPPQPREEHPVHTGTLHYTTYPKSHFLPVPLGTPRWRKDFHGANTSFTDITTCSSGGNLRKWSSLILKPSSCACSVCPHVGFAFLQHATPVPCTPSPGKSSRCSSKRTTRAALSTDPCPKNLRSPCHLIAVSSTHLPKYACRKPWPAR